MKSRSVESYQFVGLIFGLMHVKRLTIPVLVRCVCQSNHLTRGKVVFESSVALSSSWKRNVQSSNCREEKVEGFYENLSTTRGTLNSRTVEQLAGIRLSRKVVPDKGARTRGRATAEQIVNSSENGSARIKVK